MCLDDAWADYEPNRQDNTVQCACQIWAPLGEPPARPYTQEIQRCPSITLDGARVGVDARVAQGDAKDPGEFLSFDIVHQLPPFSNRV